MFELKNAAEVQAKLEAWCAKARETATAVAKGVAVEAYRRMLDEAPQYSGDFAANLNLSVNEPDRTFNPGVVNPKVNGKLSLGPLHAGHERAIQYAKAKARGPLASFKLGDTIYVTSTAEHTRPYAVLIEKNMIKFRPENPYNGATFSRAKTAVAAKYQTITGAQVAALAKGRLV